MKMPTQKLPILKLILWNAIVIAQWQLTAQQRFDNSIFTVWRQIRFVWTQLLISLNTLFGNYFGKSILPPGPLCLWQCFNKQTLSFLLVWDEQTMMSFSPIHSATPREWLAHSGVTVLTTSVTQCQQWWRANHGSAVQTPDLAIVLRSIWFLVSALRSTIGRNVKKYLLLGLEWSKWPKWSRQCQSKVTFSIMGVVCCHHF